MKKVTQKMIDNWSSKKTHLSDKQKTQAVALFDSVKFNKFDFVDAVKALSISKSEAQRLLNLLDDGRCISYYNKWLLYQNDSNWCALVTALNNSHIQFISLVETIQENNHHSESYRKKYQFNNNVLELVKLKNDC